MPRAFLIKKKHSTGIGNFRATSPKLFSPTSSGIASPNSSIGSTGSVSPRNDENDDGNNIQISSPKYSFNKDNNQGLDLSMKSLLKETNSLAEKTQKNEFPVTYGKPLYHELSFVSSYPYPAKFAKIADFLRNSEVSKAASAISPIISAAARHSPKNYELESSISSAPVSGTVIAQPQFSSSENVSKALASESYHRLPPYSINWSEHFSVNKMTIVSPTPSSQGSDDSGRGSEHSEDSSMEKSTENGSEKSSHLKKCDRYQCTDCNKNYSTQSGLAKHQEFHCATQIKKSFSCKHCEKVYVSLGALKMHIRTHTLPCKCKLCGKAFSRPWLLQGHIRTHTGEKPFACQYCNRAFADRSNLRAHLQTHSVVKKYSCKTCSRTFSRMSLLLKHEDNGCGGSRSSSEMDNSSSVDL